MICPVLLVTKEVELIDRRLVQVWPKNPQDVFVNA